MESATRVWTRSEIRIRSGVMMTRIDHSRPVASFLFYRNSFWVVCGDGGMDDVKELKDGKRDQR